MPDLKSEMSKVINQWNDDDMPTTPTTMTPTGSHKITNNATRTTFNYVRDNPGVLRSDAITALNRLGIKQSSSSSLLSIMAARGNIRMTPSGALIPVQKEYAPITKPRPAKAAPVPVVKEVPPPPEWTVDSVIGHLNVRQAMAVYSELRGIFGA
jgi:hypothetical protein